MEATRNITNDLVTDYINGFYQPATPELGQLRLEAEAERVPIILKESESFLGVFLNTLQPKRILEVGCAVGYSAMFFAEKTGARVVTIEKDPEIFQTAVSNVEKLGYQDSVTILEGDGEECINGLKEAGEADFDLIFIDAAKSHYKRFLDAALTVATADAVIIADNVLFKARIASDEYDPTGKHKTNIKRMREFLDYIHEREDMDTSVIAVGDGLSITKMKR